MEKSKFYVLQQADADKFLRGITDVKMGEEETSSGSPFSLMGRMGGVKTGKYYIVMDSDVTEKLVGISDDDQTIFEGLKWELLREEEYNGKTYIILTAWGNFPGAPMHFVELGNGSTIPVSKFQQFEGHEIGIEKSLFAKFIKLNMSQYPDFYTVEKMKRTVGLENFQF